jgi:transcriptional regulator with XRE-family HTH domain
MSIHEAERAQGRGRARILAADSRGSSPIRPLTVSLHDNGERTTPVDPLRLLLGRVGPMVERYLGNHADLLPREKEALKHYLATIGVVLRAYDGAVERFRGMPLPEGFRVGLGRSLFERAGEIGELRAQVEALSAQLSAKEETVERLAGKVEGLERDNAQVTQQLSSRDEEIERLRVQGEEQSAALTTKDEEIERLVGQVEGLEGDNVRLAQQLEFATEAVRTLQELLASQRAPSGQEAESIRDVEAENAANAKKWLHTFVRWGVAKGIRALRLDVAHEVMTLDYFANNKIFMNPLNLGRIENGIHLPERETRERIREGSLLKDFGTDSKIMQFMRVMSDIKGPLAVFGREELERSELGGMVQYFRIALGLSREELAELFTEQTAQRLGKTKDALKASERTTKIKVASLEANRYDASTDYKLRQLDKVFAWLDLPEGHPLREIFIRKAQNLPVEIDDETYNGLLAGRFLFKDPSHMEYPVAVSTLDSEIMAAIEKQRDKGLGAAIKLIRQTMGKRQIDVTQAVGTMHTGAYSQLETGATKSLHTTIVEVLYGLDNSYTIHHPLVQLILDIADERAKTGPGVERQLIKEVCNLGYSHARTVVFESGQHSHPA